MAQANPYINFNGNCREAMTFYKECFGGNLSLQTVGGSPIENQCPAGMKDQILHAMLMKDGFVLMGSDMIGPGGLQMGNNVCVMVNCNSEEEINSFFSNISKGGEIIDALSVKFWGAMFGVVNDKFGIRWMFNYDKNMQ